MSLGGPESDRAGIANAERLIPGVQSRLCSARGTSPREVRERRALLEQLFRHLESLERKPEAKLDATQRQLSVAQALLEGASPADQQKWNVEIARLLRHHGLLPWWRSGHC